MLGFLNKGSNHTPRGAVRPSILLSPAYAEADYEKCEDTIADNVLTDNVDETWNSGRHATTSEPVALDISLGMEDKLIDKVVLVPYQVPTPAVTHHRVWLDGQLVAEVKGETTHHTPLPEVPIGRMGRRLRIETVESPSWVAWSKVQVYGADAQ